MLKRYFNEDDFHNDFFGGDDDGQEEEVEFIQYVGKEDLISSIQDMEMFEMEFNGKVLQMAVDMAEKTWLWRFRSVEKKIAIIQKTYDALNAILASTDAIKDLDLSEEDEIEEE